MKLNIVILAAGQGTRMKSSLPKVLHPLGGKPMVAHVISCAKKLNADKIIMVYGFGGEHLQKTINDEQLIWVEQAQQHGTGHAVQQAIPELDTDAKVLVLYGDVPLITAETLTKLLTAANDHALAVLSIDLHNPTGYGRIVRDANNNVLSIVEEKDASEQQKLITEINTGFIAVNVKNIRQWLAKLQNNNAQAEYYLTDIISMAVNDGIAVNTVQTDYEDEVLGINSKHQLAYLERSYQLKLAEELMTQGVSVMDPARLDIRGTLHVGTDVCIDTNVIFEGEVIIGNNVSIAANCVIKDCTLEDDVEILAMCHLEGGVIGKGSRVGPFARIRPGAVLVGHNHIGNFVEIKNSQISTGSKVNHLSYIGDTDMGSSVNIGAGCITANYDGVNKHRTTIGDDVSIGSNSVLVAPIKVGKGATLGAVTVLTLDAPEGELTISRSPQKTIKGWKRPQKK